MSLSKTVVNQLIKERNKLIKKKSTLTAKAQKMKYDLSVYSDKINNINNQINKMNEMNEKTYPQTVLMAIAAGSETVENTGSATKLITGIAPLKVLAVNPTKKELETIYGRELEKEPEYLSADEAGVKKLRIDFIVQTVIGENPFCNEEVITKISYFLEDKPAITSGGDKVYMLNLYGESACIPLEMAKAGKVPENMAWYNTTKMRPAFRGEVELIDFLRAYINIPNRAFKDKVIPDVSKAEIQLESVKKYFVAGDISEFKNPVKIKIPTNKVLMAGGVRTTEDNKQYQSWYTKKPLKYATMNFDYIKRDIKDRQSQLNVDFGPEDLKFRIFGNEPTSFTQQQPATGSSLLDGPINDDPFSQALNTGIPANAATASWFEEQQ